MTAQWETQASLVQPIYYLYWKKSKRLKWGPGLDWRFQHAYVAAFT